MTHGEKRSRRRRRHIQEGLNAMRDGVFQGAQKGQLPKLRSETCATQESSRAKRLKADRSARLRTNTGQERKDGGTGETRRPQKGGRVPGKD